jgi:predicted transcriptional regulator
LTNEESDNQTHGEEFYSEIGQKGGQRVRKLIEESKEEEVQQEQVASTETPEIQTVEVAPTKLRPQNVYKVMRAVFLSAKGKTKLCKLAHVDPMSAQKYLDRLVAANFLAKTGTDAHPLYQITEAGKPFYKNLKSALNANDATRVKALVEENKL